MEICWLINKWSAMHCLILLKFGRVVHFGLTITAENKHRTSGLRCQCSANCHCLQFWPLNVWSVLYAMSDRVCSSVYPSHSWVTPSHAAFNMALVGFLSFLRPNFVILNLGIRPNECVKERHPVSRAKNGPITAISWKRCKLQLGLLTHRKWHKSFPLVPMTLNDVVVFFA